MISIILFYTSLFLNNREVIFKQNIIVKKLFLKLITKSVVRINPFTATLFFRAWHGLEN